MAREMRKIYLPFIVLLFQTLHILCDMPTENILFQNFRVQLFRFWIIARETFLVVGNVQTTIAGAFKSPKEARTGRSALQSNVKVTFERSRRIFIKGLGQRNGAIRFCDALVLVSKAQLCQRATGDKKTSGICCRMRYQEKIRAES